jgi:hypothetical protein
MRGVLSAHLFQDRGYYEEGIGLFGSHKSLLNDSCVPWI